MSAEDDQKGLYTKYILHKRVACDCGADIRCGKCEGRGFTLREVDPSAQYFILRIDEDDWHGQASRIALAAYAWMAGGYNTQLEIDLKRWVTDNEPVHTHPNASVAAGRMAKERFLEFIKENAEPSDRE